MSYFADQRADKQQWTLLYMCNRMSNYTLVAYPKYTFIFLNLMIGQNVFKTEYHNSQNFQIVPLIPYHFKFGKKSRFVKDENVFYSISSFTVYRV